MSTLVADVYALQAKYGFNHEPLNREKLALRVDQVEEEFDELLSAFSENDAEAMVDALIDITVFALGTLAIAGVDVEEAWQEVHLANMSKIRGTKEGRDHSGGWDLIKPKNWEAPDHGNNLGFIPDALEL
mgnify:FL=1|tara:strand:+ start:384 stop:773 length:390 start_codon:yes stop_codon:yes gene_type:complete